MIRVSCLLARDPALSRAAFLERWRDEVGPLVASMQSRLDIVRYVQTHPDPDASAADRDARAARGCPEFSFDAMGDYWFASAEAVADLLSQAQSREMLRAVAKAEQRLCDPGRSVVWAGYEYPQVATGHARIVARPRTPMMKLAFILYGHDSMSETKAREYWLHDHGPLIRSHAVARGMACYQQVHRCEADVLPDLAEALGHRIGDFLGHAEAWFDRSVARAGPDVDAARNDAIADERRFIDLPRSMLFSGKEYLFIDREWRL